MQKQNIIETCMQSSSCYEQDYDPVLLLIFGHTAFTNTPTPRIYLLQWPDSCSQASPLDIHTP